MMDLLLIYILFTFAVFFAGITICLTSAFVSSLAAGLFSLSSALLYFALNAPDVSMTEASVAVFFSGAIYLMTARVTRAEYFEPPSLIKIFLAAIVTSLVLYFIYKSLFLIGEFGSIQIAIEGSSKHHLLTSYKDFKIANVITTILASFRGFDTMGETIIILTSAIGIFIILESKNKNLNTLE